MKRKILNGYCSSWKTQKIKVKFLILLYPQVKIYSKFHKESDINPADISKKKIPVEINNRSKNEKIWGGYGGDLDIPGSELDDAWWKR
jgi:hypothetical protein